MPARGTLSALAGIELPDRSADQLVADAVRLQERLTNIRRYADEVKALRDRTLLLAAAAGVDRGQLARDVGMDRSTLYVALTLGGTEGAQDVAATLADAEEAMSEAHVLWQLAGRVGSPDDHWPLA